MTIQVLHVFSGSIRYDNMRVLSKHFDRSTYQLSFASIASKGQLHLDATEAGLDSFALATASRRELAGAALRLARELRRRRIDVLQTHLFEASLVGAVAGRLARVPLVIMTAHHSRELHLLGRRLPLLADSVTARVVAHRIIAPTHETADAMVSMEHVSPSKIAVVPHGFDFNRWRAVPGGRRRARAALSVADDAIVLGAVGRLNWIKDHEVLVTAFASAAKAQPKAVLVIIGSGDASGLHHLAASLGIGDRLVTPGLRSDVDDLYDSFDVFVQSSRGESFGMSLVEAMAKELPVISTSVGIAPEVIEHGSSGWLVPPGNAPALARAITAVFADPAAWPDIGRRARAAVSHLSEEAMVRAYEDLYRRWLDERQSP